MESVAGKCTAYAMDGGRLGFSYDGPTDPQVVPLENLSMRFLSTLSLAGSNPNWLPAGLIAGLMGSAILVAGCGGDSDETRAVKLQ